MGLRKCCVPGCGNTKSPFRKFPIYEEDVYNVWLERIGNQELYELHPEKVYVRKVICDSHFAECCRTEGTRRLNYQSLPTINLPGFQGAPDRENSFLFYFLGRKQLPESYYKKLKLQPDPLSLKTNELDPSQTDKSIAKAPSSNDEGNANLPKYDTKSVSNNVATSTSVENRNVPATKTFSILLNELTDSPVLDDPDGDFDIVETNDAVTDACDDATSKENEDCKIDISDTTVNTAQDPSGKKDGFSLTPENISTICRTCLKQKDVLDLYETKYEDLTFADILEMCSATKLKEDESLSQNICKTCCNELLQAFHFRLKCIKSEKILESFKIELARSQQRSATILKKQRSLTLRFHDYENILNENDVLNITGPKRPEDDGGDVTFAADSSDTSQPNMKKRFYLIKGPVDSGKGVQMSEIDEDNAKTLIGDKTEKPMCMKVGNAVCNITKATLQPGQEINDMVKGEFKSAMIRNLNKRKMLAYSQWIKPAIRSIMTGRFSNNYLVKPRRTTKKRKRNSDSSPPKPKDRKVIVPGTCETCNEPYQTMEEYKQHARVTKHYLNPYVCKICDKIFPNKYRLQSHYSINHEDARAHMCEKCGKCYKTRGYLLIHLKTHSKTDYVCKECGDSFGTLSDVVQHKKRAHRSSRKKLFCEYCGEFFSGQDTLRHHRNSIHLNIKRQFCHICGKGYQYKSTLKKHMHSHSTQQFDCSLCNKSFKLESRYMQHVKLIHPGTDQFTKQEDEVKIIECKYCDKYCRNKQSYSLHIRKDHEGAACIYCDHLFETTEELTKHAQAEHADIPDFSCRYCGRCYPDPLVLYGHLDTHRMKFFQCTLCHKKFGNKVGLKIHMVIHTGEKLFECQYCDKTFMYSSSRVIHERLHTGERPYVCDICGKACICISSCKRHRMTHILPVPMKRVSNQTVETKEVRKDETNEVESAVVAVYDGNDSDMIPVFEIDETSESVPVSEFETGEFEKVQGNDSVAVTEFGESDLMMVSALDDPFEVIVATEGVTE